jgi:hypothetical protein
MPGLQAIPEREIQGSLSLSLRRFVLLKPMSLFFRLRPIQDILSTVIAAAEAGQIFKTPEAGGYNFLASV